jgi:hypothetical protein
MRRHHPDVQRFLEWCKDKGFLGRYRAFLQRQAEHSPQDVERLMAAVDVGMKSWKWGRARKSNAKIPAARKKTAKRAKKRTPRRTRAPRVPRSGS